MEKISTIIIDDEPLALSLVKDYVGKTHFLDLKGEFDNPLDASEYLAGNTVQLIILDIQMPDLTGIEFIRTLQNPPKIIFTTAYEKYAVEGFRVNAVDYLLKPFSYPEFLTSVQKAKKIIELEASANTEIQVNKQFLFLKSEYKLRRINFDDILYIEGLKDYVKVFTTQAEKPVMSLITLKLLEEKLPSDQFLRVHRSYIVNTTKVDTIERGNILFGKTVIPVSDAYKEIFQEFIRKNFL